MPSLNLTAAILNLQLTAGRDTAFTITAENFSSVDCSSFAQFRQTPDLNSNVLFEMSSSGSSAQIIQTPGVNSSFTFQVLAADTADLGGQTIYWSWKITFQDGSIADWAEGQVTIDPTPTV